MNHDLKLTLCIATFNGAKKLPKTLDAILSSTKLPNEIVIYIDGSTDNTLDVLKIYEARLPLKIITGINSGRATARNKALEHVSGDIVMFIDDDIIIPPNSIYEHFRFQQAIAGRVLTVPSFTIPNDYDFSKFKVHLERKWNEIAYENSDNQAFSAACFSIRKTDMVAIGGFYNGLNDAEDYEFGIRARKNNLVIVVRPDLWAKHNDEINCERFIKRNRQYFKANEDLLDDHIIEESQYVNKTHPVYKKIIFYFLAAKFLVKLIDRNFFVFLYQPVRYKLYDYVSAAFIHYYPHKKI